MQASAKRAPRAPRQPDRYKVAVVFINDYSTKPTTVPGREPEQNPMHYRGCSTFARARMLVNDKYGAASTAPKISLAIIYSLEKPANSPPVAVWTIEKEWNNDVNNFQGTQGRSLPPAAAQ